MKYKLRWITYSFQKNYKNLIEGNGPKLKWYCLPLLMNKLPYIKKILYICACKPSVTITYSLPELTPEFNLTQPLIFEHNYIR